MAIFEREGVKRVRRNPWWLLLGASPWVVGLGLIVTALVLRNPGPLVPLFHFAMFGALGFYFAYRANKSPRLHDGLLRIDDDTVSFAGKVLCQRRDLRSALLVPRDGQLYLRLTRGRGLPALLLAVSSEQHGREILRTLGFDASQSVAELRALSPYFALPGYKQLLASLAPVLLAGVMIPITALAGRTAAPFAALAFVLTTLLFVTATLWPSRLSVGADGVLSRWLWRSRFFPFSQVQRVDPIERRTLNKRYLGVELTLRDGSTTFLPIGQKRWSEEEFHATVERIREAIEVYRSGSLGEGASVLERAGREPSAWVVALRRIGEGANADLRTAPVHPEQLARLVADPSARPAARASAAVALAATRAPAELERIRIAAETAAAPRLRVALSRAADASASDAELAELLAELEAEDATQTAKAG